MVLGHAGRCRPGSNPANWQWVAGSGADAAPVFPRVQSGPAGREVPSGWRVCPALGAGTGAIASRLVHKPWSATPLELKGAGVELGKTYPEPIIIAHRLGRERALKAYARIRER
jgi:deoxyribodipyrimidine photo-lyase